jgi:hypothetical protein
VDQPRDPRLAGAGGAGEEHADVVRRRDPDVPEQPGEGLAPPDDVVHAGRAAVRERRVGLLAAPAAEEEAIGEHRDGPGEVLGEEPVLGGERAG